MPSGAVYVGRGSRWGNPWVVGERGVRTRAEAVRLYREWWACLPSAQPGSTLHALNAMLPTLCGRPLSCWCPLDGEPCHADVLLELANAPLVCEAAHA